MAHTEKCRGCMYENACDYMDCRTEKRNNMEIYTILHTCINTKGDHDEANGRIIGVYSNRDTAIKQAEKWIEATKTSDVFIKHITETEWYFWYEENNITYGGYVTIETCVLNKDI